MKRMIAAVLVGMCLIISGCKAPVSVPSGETENSVCVTATVTTSTETRQTETAQTETTVSSVKSTTFTGKTSRQSTKSSVFSSRTTFSSSQTSRESQKTSALETQTSVTVTGKTEPTATPNDSKEFRGVWVSYIELQDLLHKNNTPQKAKQAIDSLMDHCASLGLNTVIWMVRGHSDAYYESNLFLPNAYAAPLLEVGFDPLKYAVAAAHKRGLKLHAWVNPYRIGRNKTTAVCEDFFYYNGKYYYVPTSEKVQTLILNGLTELVTHYAIDGIHFDDYFYPEGCAGEKKAASFESAAYTAYVQKTGGAALRPGDWRRDAVNRMVRAAYEVAHSRKDCVFGISPSHDYEKTYGQMYADSQLWLAKEGYVDYLCPQVYFGFEHGSAPFADLVDDWLSYPKSNSVELYFGLGLYKIGLSPDRYAKTAAGKSEWIDHSDIMKRSVLYLRSKAACGGMALYSYSYLDPDTRRDLSSWQENGSTVKQTYNKTVASKEIMALKEVLS